LAEEWFRTNSII